MTQQKKTQLLDPATLRWAARAARDSRGETKGRQEVTDNDFDQSSASKRLERVLIASQSAAYGNNAQKNAAALAASQMSYGNDTVTMSRAVLNGMIDDARRGAEAEVARLTAELEEAQNTLLAMRVAVLEDAAAKSRPCAV